MMMSDAEIAAHYRQAKNPAADVMVLAELNATDKDTIRAALEREGIELPKKRTRKKKGGEAPPEVVPELPAVEKQATQWEGLENTFWSVRSILEAVPEGASQYTRETAVQLADAMMKDYLRSWKSETKTEAG